jgi:hypothetical protein
MNHVGFCVECGSKLDDDSKFCEACGAKVIQLDPATDGNASAEAQNMQPTPPYPYPQAPQSAQPTPPYPYPQAPQSAQPTPPYSPPPAPQPQARSKRFPPWGFAVLAVILLAVIAVVFWNPLQSLMQSISSAPATQAATSDEDKPASPMFSQDAMSGPYMFHTEVLEVTKNDVIMDDPELPAGILSDFPVFFSMGKENGGTLYVTGNHTPDGLPSIMIGAFIGDEVQILDIDSKENIIRTYYGKTKEVNDDIVIEGTYEEIHDEKTPDEKVVHGNWRMESLQAYEFEGVDITKAYKNASWTDTGGRWTGTLTYTRILNLDESTTFSEKDKEQYKGYIDTPLEVELQVEPEYVEITIFHPNSDIVTKQRFSPVDEHEGVLYARTTNDDPDLHMLGGAFIRQGFGLRFDACYTRLIAMDGNPVIMTMFINARPAE